VVLVACGGPEVGALLPRPAALPGAPPAGSCTEVVGFSQTREWFIGFQGPAGDTVHQGRTQNGAEIQFWANPTYYGWTSPVLSACSVGSSAPSAVLFNISGHYGDDVEAWAQGIRNALVVAHARYPGVDIALMPVVGGADCYVNGVQVRASYQHPYISEAIDIVAAEDPYAYPGHRETVDTCSMFRDEKGHFTQPGAQDTGRDIATALYG
jgi:hypothetical protein